MIDYKWNDLRGKLDYLISTRYPELEEVWHHDGLGNNIICILYEHFRSD